MSFGEIYYNSRQALKSQKTSWIHMTLTGEIQGVFCNLVRENLLNYNGPLCIISQIPVLISCSIHLSVVINVPSGPCWSICSGPLSGSASYIVLTQETGLTHCGQDKMDTIFQTSFSNAFSWMKMYKFWLRFHWSLFPRVQLTNSSISSDNGLAPARRQAII